MGGEAVYTDNGVLFIRSQNVNNDQLELENVVFIPDAINRQMKNSIVNPNDILLNITGASLGRSCVVPDNFTEGNVNQHVCIIRLNREYNPRFIQPIFSSNKGRNIFNSLQTGSGREGLNFQSIKSIRLYLPPTNEQSKISSFLNLIEMQTSSARKKIENLESLMKSVSKKLLTQKIRFEEFTDDWKKVKIGGVCEKKSSNISANKIENNHGEYPIYGATGLLKSIDFFEVEPEYIAIVKDGAGVGRLLICQEKSSVLGTLDILLPKKTNLVFLFHILSNINFAKYITGSTIPHIYFKDYKNEICEIPSLEEQTKIANVLTKIAEKIETEKKLLELLEQQKKYFLQNLFV